MINNYISISSQYYSHSRAFFVLISTILIDETEILFMAIQQDVLLNKILKKGLAKKIDNFLQVSKKISNKKKRLLNIPKRKLALQKPKLKTIIISLLDNFGKKDMPIPLKRAKIGTKEVDITIISIDAYCEVCKLKKA